MTILYVGGWGRSGSTLIGNILNEIKEFIHVGELRHIWENGFIHDRSCGCGRTFHECKLWSQVARRVHASESIPDPERMAQLRDTVGAKNSDVIWRVLGLGKPTSEETTYARAVTRLYEIIADVAECSVIVDTSKTPSHGFTLYESGLDVQFVHLVRDPRATAFSWQRKIRREDTYGTRHMESFTPYANAKRWMICNGTMEAIRQAVPDRYSLIKYEHFVQDPKHTITRLLRNHGFHSTPRFRDKHEVYLSGNHTVWGNPKRSRTGYISIYDDDEWKQSLPSQDRSTVTALTWPLLARYDYLNII